MFVGHRLHVRSHIFNQQLILSCHCHPRNPSLILHMFVLIPFCAIATHNGISRIEIVGHGHGWTMRSHRFKLNWSFPISPNAIIESLAFVSIEPIEALMFASSCRRRCSTVQNVFMCIVQRALCISTLTAHWIRGQYICVFGAVCVCIYVTPRSPNEYRSRSRCTNCPLHTETMPANTPHTIAWFIHRCQDLCTSHCTQTHSICSVSPFPLSWPAPKLPQ